MLRVSLLGIPIDPLTMQQAIVRLHEFLSGGVQHHVMTVNSEMLVESTRNPVFADVMKRTSLNLPDSQGVVWAAKWTGQTRAERVTGVDCVTTLLAGLSSDHPVFLLGAGEGIASRAAEVLRRNNPKLRIVGTYAGSPRAQDASDIIRRITATEPRLLLVAYGAPAQDLWIALHLKELPSVRVAIGVGGTFDFIAGKRTRAPTLLRSLGLEWLWRVIVEPRRIGRIANAVVVFPFLVLRYGKQTKQQTSPLP